MIQKKGKRRARAAGTARQKRKRKIRLQQRRRAPGPSFSLFLYLIFRPPVPPCPSRAFSVRSIPEPGPLPGVQRGVLRRDPRAHFFAQLRQRSGSKRAVQPGRRAERPVKDPAPEWTGRKRPGKGRAEQEA